MGRWIRNGPPRGGRARVCWNRGWVVTSRATRAPSKGLRCRGCHGCWHDPGRPCTTLTRVGATGDAGESPRKGMIRGTKSPHGLALAADQLTHSGAFGARGLQGAHRLRS